MFAGVVLSPQTGSVWVGSKFAMLLTSAPVLPTMASHWAESVWTAQPRPVSRRHTHAHAQAQCYIRMIHVSICLAWLVWMGMTSNDCELVYYVCFHCYSVSICWLHAQLMWCSSFVLQTAGQQLLATVAIGLNSSLPTTQVSSKCVNNVIAALYVHTCHKHTRSFIWKCKYTTVQYRSFILHQSNMCFNVFLMH